MEPSSNVPVSNAQNTSMSTPRAWPRKFGLCHHWLGNVKCSTSVTRRSVFSFLSILGLALLGLSAWAAYTERLLEDFSSGTAAKVERQALLGNNPRRALEGRSLLWDAAAENHTTERNITREEMLSRMSLVQTPTGEARGVKITSHAGTNSLNKTSVSSPGVGMNVQDVNGSISEQIVLDTTVSATDKAVPMTTGWVKSIGLADGATSSYHFQQLGKGRSSQTTQAPQAKLRTTFTPGETLTGSITGFEQAQSGLPGTQKHPWTTMMRQDTRAERKWTLGYKFFIFAFVATIAFSGFLLARLHHHWKTGPRHGVESHVQWEPLPNMEEDETSNTNTWTIAVGSEGHGIQLAEVFHERHRPQAQEHVSHLPCRRLSLSPSESEPECELDPAVNTAPAATSSSDQPGIEIKVLPAESPSCKTSSDADRDSPQRIVFMYASPFCYMNALRRPVPMVQIPFEREWDLLVHAYDEAVAALRTSKACRQCPSALLEAQPLTAASLQRMLAPSPNPQGMMATVLHLSAHGAQGHLVLDNGRGTAHLFDCATMGSMLDIHREDGHTAPARLVVFNCCNLRSVGMQFVNGGVPHVICSRGDLHDSASQVFLGTMYSNLFQGRSVAQAFHAALVSLRSDPETATRTSAEDFCLLPENADHSEVLFCPEEPQSSHVQQAVQQLRMRPANTINSAQLALAVPSAGSQGDQRCHSSMLTARAFLVRDGASSSSDGPEDSHSSEGHVETSSTSASACPDEASSDSDGALPKKSERIGSDGAMPPHVDGASENPSNACQVTIDSPTCFTQKSRLQVSLLSEKRNLSRRVATCAMRARKRLAHPTDSCMSMYNRTSANDIAMPQSPFGCAMPLLPEDFVGRSVDIWTVLQHISNRRAVVVCGSQNTENGVGKSSLLSAVHRAFTLQMCGICVTVQLNTLSSDSNMTDASSHGWVDKVKSSVLRALKEQKGLSCKQDGAVTRPRPATTWHGIGSVLGSQMFKAQSMMRSARHASRWSGRRSFHPVNDIAGRREEEILDELVAAMGALAELCEMRCRQWPAAGPNILLLLDECDHLIQQPHFQRAIAELLQRCGTYRLVLSTQQPMVDTFGCWFKVVHHTVEGLEPRDAARLFLRRAHRPVTWGEILDQSRNEGLAASLASNHADSFVVTTKDNENDVLDIVAAHPAIYAQRGNPRRIVELASKVHPSLKSISDLISTSEGPAST